MLFAGRSQLGLRCRPLALEARLLFDGAGLATAAQAADPGTAAPAGLTTDAALSDAGLSDALTADGSDAVFIATAPTSEHDVADGAVQISVHKGAFADVAALDAAVAAGPSEVGDASVGGVDAADTVHFAISVVNDGEGAAFDLQVQDRLPPGFDASMVGDLRLIGDSGTVIDFSGGNVVRNAASGEAIRSNGEFAEALFCGDAVEFVDPGHGEGFLGGACDGSRPAMVTIAYSLTLPVSVVAGETVVNEASVIHAAEQECGPNVVSACDPPSDPASVTIVGAELTTRLTDTNQVHTEGADAVIGEILTYETVVTIPEGSSPDAVLTHLLQPGLSLVSIDRIVTSDGVSFSNAVDAGAIEPSDADGGSANRFVIDFGTIINRNTDNCVADTVTVVYRAVTDNVIDNQQGATRSTQAGYTSSDGSAPTDCGAAPPSLVDLEADAEPITVVEPVLTVDVTPDDGPVVAGGQAVFVVTVRNDSDIDAFDVRIDDLSLPPGLVFASGAWLPTADASQRAGGMGGAQLVAAAVAVPTLPVLRAGEQATWRFVADVAADAPAGTELPVDVAVRYSSIPDSMSYADGYPPGTDNGNLSPFVATGDRERTGVDGPGGLDDYYAADSGSVVAEAAAPPPAPPPGPGPIPVEPPAPPAPVAGPPPADLTPPPAPLADGPSPTDLFPPLALANPFSRDAAPIDFKMADLPPIVAGDKAISTEKAVAPDDDCIPAKPPVVKQAAVAKPAVRSVFADAVVKKKDVSEPAVPLKKRAVPVMAKPRPAPDC